jgi:hypothetical protein
MTHNVQLENLLSAVTDALLAGSQDVDAVLRRYDVPRQRVEGLVTLVRRLHMTLTGVEPSRRFVQRLRSDLMGTQQQGLIARVRYLPPRVQIAAGVMAVVGFMLLVRGRLIDDVHQENVEVAPQQQ